MPILMHMPNKAAWDLLLQELEDTLPKKIAYM
jgi:hypothetical protein